MPLPNKRVAVLGVKKAEGDWDRYVRQRLQAERGAKVLDQELREVQADAERLNAEIRRGG